MYNSHIYSIIIFYMTDYRILHLFKRFELQDLLLLTYNIVSRLKQHISQYSCSFQEVVVAKVPDLYSQHIRRVAESQVLAK